MTKATTTLTRAEGQHVQLVGELQLFKHPQGAEGAGAEAVVEVEHGGRRSGYVGNFERRVLLLSAPGPPGGGSQPFD